MKRSRKKQSVSTSPAPEPTAEQLQQYIECMAEDHQKAWHHELMGESPYWEHMLGLHLRLVELEHMESAAQELL